MPRTTSVYMDSIIDKAHPVLDKGFLRVVDYMGDQTSITQAARVSYGAGIKKRSEDVGLLRYLMRHDHLTPFEMVIVKFHVKLPIFVARQWMRHRTSFNEYSARYSILSNEFYSPDADRLGVQSDINKQGTGQRFDDAVSSEILERLQTSALESFDTYDTNIETGLSRELARISLPMSTYTEFYWTVNLRSLLHFVALRSDHHAQKEIQDYSNLIGTIIEGWMPDVWSAFNDYHPLREAHTFSGPELQILLSLIDRSRITDDVLSKIPKREREEFLSLLS